MAHVVMRDAMLFDLMLVERRLGREFMSRVSIIGVLVNADRTNDASHFHDSIPSNQFKEHLGSPPDLLCLERRIFFDDIGKDEPPDRFIECCSWDPGTLDHVISC